MEHKSVVQVTVKGDLPQTTAGVNEAFRSGSIPDLAGTAFERRAAVTGLHRLRDKTALQSSEPKHQELRRRTSIDYSAYLLHPPDIEAGLKSGNLIRYGGVVRDRMGNIVKHLKEVPSPAKSQGVVGRVAASVKRPRGIITATALGVVAVGVTTIIAAGKREEAGKPEVPEHIENYDASLRAYLEAVRGGSLDAGIIGQLISDFDAVKAYSNNGDIIVDFSTEQSETLVNLVVDYTRKLAEANSVELDELRGQASASENEAVVDLRRHLEVQRQIFTGAA